MDAREDELDHLEYQKIEEFRFQLRRFLNFSETSAREAGLEPQQHQTLLVIKAASTAEDAPAIGHIAQRLFLKHHSVVGLIDRLEALQLVRRTTSPRDARQVLVRLTAKGDRVLHKLSVAHRTELEQTGPELIAALRFVTRRTPQKSL